MPTLVFDTPSGITHKREIGFAKKHDRPCDRDDRGPCDQRPLPARRQRPAQRAGTRQHKAQQRHHPEEVERGVFVAAPHQQERGHQIRHRQHGGQRDRAGAIPNRTPSPPGWRWPTRSFAAANSGVARYASANAASDGRRDDDDARWAWIIRARRPSPSQCDWCAETCQPLARASRDSRP